MLCGYLTELLISSVVVNWWFSKSRDGFLNIYPSCSDQSCLNLKLKQINKFEGGFFLAQPKIATSSHLIGKPATREVVWGLMPKSDYISKTTHGTLIKSPACQSAFFLPNLPTAMYSLTFLL